MDWGIIIWPLVGGLVLWVIIAAVVRAPGASLQGKAGALGDVRTRTRAEIIGGLGQPSAISAVPGGKQLLQWQATGYHLALLFDGETCLGISHEFSG